MIEDSFGPATEAGIGSWDIETDVLVVGFGAAGTCAAWSAATEGAAVLVAERAGAGGGAAAMSEGIIYLGGGTPVQRACGFEDSVDEMFAYMTAACGPHPDEPRIEKYCATSLEHFDWLVERGVVFDPSFCRETSMAPIGEEGLVYSGGEDAYPFNEIARPAPRGHLAKTRGSTGWLLMECLVRSAKEAGVIVETDLMVTKLVVASDGAVVGALARRYGESVSVRARRAVVLTAGGFVFNDEMLARHCPPLLKGTFKVGTEGDDGRGIMMAQAAGAAVKNMYAGEVALPWIPPRRLIEGIIVNGRGQRFINEDTYIGRIGQAALYDHDGVAFLLVDEKAYTENWMGLKASWVCETIPELEKEIGLPEGSLETTIALYNRHASDNSGPPGISVGRFRDPRPSSAHAGVRVQLVRA